MFPFEIGDDDAELEEKEEIPYREYEIDFRTGQLTGRIAEGTDAIKAWIFLALRTERYRFQQFSWDYGSELEELIGESADSEYVGMQAERMITDCLMQNGHISGISGLSAEVRDEKVTVRFTVETDYGEVTVNV